MNLSLLLHQVENLQEQVKTYDRQIEKISQQAVYARRVQALGCFRGIGILSAMRLISEIGDAQRFDHPRRLTSYAGMDLKESSSGGKQRRFQMTKMGNRHIRTTVIESCQGVLNAPQLSRALKQRRREAEPEMVRLADRAMKRLYKKGQHLWHANKAKNKIKTACARELLSFVWESLRAFA